jgi:hypothetical protein
VSCRVALRQYRVVISRCKIRASGSILMPIRDKPRLKTGSSRHLNDLGFDEDGDPVTSCIVEEVPAPGDATNPHPPN